MYSVLFYTIIEYLQSVCPIYLCLYSQPTVVILPPRGFSRGQGERPRWTMVDLNEGHDICSTKRRTQGLTLIVSRPVKSALTRAVRRTFDETLCFYSSYERNFFLEALQLYWPCQMCICTVDERWMSAERRLNFSSFDAVWRGLFTQHMQVRGTLLLSEETAQ